MKLSLSTGSSGVWFFSCSVSSFRNGLSPKLPPWPDSTLDSVGLLGLVMLVVVVMCVSPRSDPEIEPLGREPTGADARRGAAVARVVVVGRAGAVVRVQWLRVRARTAAVLARVHLGVRDAEARGLELPLQVGEAALQQMAE